MDVPSSLSLRSKRGSSPGLIHTGQSLMLIQKRATQDEAKGHEPFGSREIEEEKEETAPPRKLC